MGRWSKKALPTAELLQLGLSPEEGFVLSRLDIAMTPAEVVTATGLPLAKVQDILGTLGTRGVVGSDQPNDPLLISDEPPPRKQRAVSARRDPRREPSDPPPPPGPSLPSAPPPPQPREVEAKAADHEPEPPEGDPALLLPLDAASDEPPEGDPSLLMPLDEPAAELPVDAAVPTSGEPPEGDPSLLEPLDAAPIEPPEGDPSILEPLDEEPVSSSVLRAAENEERLDEEEKISDEIPEEAPDGRSYRKIYETEIRKLEQDDRYALARYGQDPKLMALCFDPDPKVLAALLENPRAGLAHARLAARHHPTGAGLEHIAKRAPLLADGQVQRALLCNQQLSETICKKILSPKRMADAYRTAINVDVPERTKAYARTVLRSKFATCQGEERAGLINATEGRVLAMLTGLMLDGRATSILASRTYTSALFVQNLARWGPCPPLLLAHLLKQNIVRRQQHLKNLVLRHPNLPADAKRKA